MMKKELVMNGKDLLKADVKLLNDFVEKCFPIWNPIFTEEFNRKDFNLVDYMKMATEVINKVKWDLSARKLDGWDIYKEFENFILNTNLEDELNKSDNKVKSACSLICMEVVLLESVLQKDNVDLEITYYNFVKAFIINLENKNLEIDVNYIVNTNEVMRYTLESLLTEDDKKIIKF
jgi:hypothetical protein